MANRRKATDNDVQKFLDGPEASTMSSEGVTYFEILDMNNEEDQLLYHAILNDTDRFVIHMEKLTWDKNQGVTLGMKIALKYTDRHADPE